MDRNEVEERIFRKLVEIVELYKKYHPGGSYLYMGLVDDWIMVNNRHWDEDECRPIDFSIEKMHGKWSWKEEQNELDDCD